MVLFLCRPLLGMAAAVVLFCYTTSPIAAQIPKVDCQVGDTVVVEFRGGQSEAVVTEILGDGAMIKADVINADGSKENWPFGAMQIKSVNSSAKHDSASEKNLLITHRPQTIKVQKSEPWTQSPTGLGRQLMKSSPSQRD